MSATLLLQNRQRHRPLDLRRLRPIARGLLRGELDRREFDLVVCAVEEQEMIRINETFLHHQGCTDVITFDYSDPDRPGLIAGELFICVAEAVRQARRFRTSWQSEFVRYLVHGVLHLSGFDDRSPGLRRRMKAEEDRLLARLADSFDLNRIDGT